MPEGSRHLDVGLLAAYLRPERARLLVLGVVLLVSTLAPVAGPVLLGTAIDAALRGEPSGELVAIALAFLVVTVGSDTLQVLVVWRSVHLAWRVGNRLRLDLARHALRLDLEWHSRHSAGLLIERLDGDVEAIVTFSSTAVLHLVGNALLLVGVVAVSLVIDWRAGLLIVVSTAVAMGVMVRFRAIAVPAHDVEREIQSQLYGDLEERLGGLEDLRANGAGPYAVHRLQHHSHRWWHAARRAALLGDGSYTLAAAAFSVGSVLTLALGVWLHRADALSIGALLALFRFSQMVRQPVERIAEQMREFQKAAAGARRAARLLAVEPSIPDGRGDPIPGGPLEVDLDHVSFAYKGDTDVLADLDLCVAPGHRLGVVGRTGSGKSTLGRLLARLWDVGGGAVRLGGVDVRDASLADLRGRVAVVSQDVELLRASLRDNLTFLGTVDATDEQLWAALRDVGLDGWAAALPGGLDTVLDDRAGLSAGQAQLLAFARVLLSNPGLVVLDEATSRLDPETERRLSAAADRALAGRTVVIIAHRLATLDRVDEVLVLERGRVLEHGSRAALADDPTSHFARLLAVSATASEVLA
ncbi:MAG: ABC transporter ATP-binding protein [Acidimicrobiales bacterium]